MLNCRINKGVSDVCTTNVAGVLKLAIANWNESIKTTASEGGCVDSIDLGTEKVYNFSVMDGTGVANATGTIGGNNDHKYFVHSVSGQLPKLDCDLIGEFNNFLLGRVVFFVLTKNHDVFMFGADNGLTAETWEFTTGQGDGDQNGVAFTFSGSQPNGPVKLTSWEVVSALINKD